MDWTFLWMMVVLKLPVAALLLTVWWAVRAVPVVEVEAVGPDEDEDEGGGGSDRLSHRHRPRPSRPRGPHGGKVPPSPPRSRPVVAAARRRDVAAR